MSVLRFFVRLWLIVPDELNCFLGLVMCLEASLFARFPLIMQCVFSMALHRSEQTGFSIHAVTSFVQLLTRRYISSIELQSMVRSLHCHTGLLRPALLYPTQTAHIFLDTHALFYNSCFDFRFSGAKQFPLRYRPA